MPTSNATDQAGGCVVCPRAADAHHARGYALRKQGDLRGAVEEYSRALALNPRHFKALFNRAFAFDKVTPLRCCFTERQ